MIILHTLLFGFSLGILIALLAEASFIRNRQKPLILAKDNLLQKKGLIEQIFYPLFSKCEFLFIHFKWEWNRKILEKMLVRACINDKFSPETFWSMQTFMAILFLGLYAFCSWYMQIFGFSLPFTPTAACFSCLVGLIYPYLWVSGKIKKRVKEILYLFPDFVSTLTLSVEAGLDYFAAMVRYLDNSESSDLTFEIGKVVSDVRLGSSREVALKDMSLRLNIVPIQNFVSVLVQATRLGTSIGTVLRAQAEKLRRDRFEAAERAGAIAAQKILFPLVFFIMPAVFLLIFGPLIVRLVTGGLESLFM